MENSLAITETSAELLESVIIKGDLAKMPPAQRLDYYQKVCQSMGLNPLTKPFDYIILNGKMTLYARKDAADQLRKINGVSIDKIETNTDGDFICITAYGHDKTGRCDVELGVVSKRDMRGDFANAMMKAMTKAKRRLTLSLCGLGWLDETEVETIPDAKQVEVADNGEIIDAPVVTVVEPALPVMPTPVRAQIPEEAKAIQAEEKKAEKPAFNEEEFLKHWEPIRSLSMPYKKAVDVESSDGKKYGDIPTERLYYMLNAITKKMSKATEEQKQEYDRKRAAINSIFVRRGADIAIKDIDDNCPF